MADYDSKIAKIEEQMRTQRERIRDLKAQATRQERKDATRRKIIYGAAYLNALERLDPEKRTRTEAAVEKHITSPRDREFLGLEPLERERSTVPAADRAKRKTSSGGTEDGAVGRRKNRTEDGDGDTGDGARTPNLPFPGSSGKAREA